MEKCSRMKKTVIQVQLFDAIEMVEQINTGKRTAPKGKLSREMERCNNYLKEVGTLVRYRGGFWAVEGLQVKPDTGAPIGPWFGTGTIDALYRRELLVFADEREGRWGKFFTRVYTAMPKTS